MTDKEVKTCSLFDIDCNELYSEKSLSRLIIESARKGNDKEVENLCKVVKNDQRIENKIVWE